MPARPLRFLDLFCLGLNSIIGSGIFLFPGLLAKAAGASSVLAFVACALLLAAVAACFGELGGMFESSGGSALYAREAFGAEAGFAVGWIAWVTAVLSWAAVASALASQLGYFDPALSGPFPVRAAAVAALAAFGALNRRGVRPAAWTVNFLTAAKAAPLAFFVAAGVFFAAPSRLAPAAGGEGRFGYAVFLALWPLQGFEIVPVPAGEAAQARRAAPRAVLASLAAAGVLYALIQAVAVAGFPGLAASGERPLAEAARFWLGPWAGGLMAAGGVVSMLGFVAGTALGAPRYLAAVGGTAFTSLRLAEAHPVLGTPHRAIAWTTGSAVVLAAAFDFSRLVDLANFAVTTQYLSTCLAFCALRLRRPDAERTARVPLGWLVGPAGCLVSAWLMTQVGAHEAKVALSLLAAGYILRLAELGVLAGRRGLARR